MSSLEGFLTNIRTGNLDACGPLADFLDDQGLCAKAKRLRARWRRWQTEQIRAQRELDSLNRHLSESVQRFEKAMRSIGGKTAYTLVITADTSHEDALLVRYVEKLLAEPD